MRKTNVQMGALVSTGGSIGTARVTLQITRNPKRPSLLETFIRPLWAAHDLGVNDKITAPCDVLST